MEDVSQLSKEEKEAFINAKMEQIRKKNEELLKRHKEVEADKKNAEVFSKAALEHKSTTYVERKPPVRNYTPRVRQPKPPQDQVKAADVPDTRRQQQRLQDGDGPPPDPVYSFLSDRTREGQLADGQVGRSRRHVGSYGGPDFTNVRSTMQDRKTQEKKKDHRSRGKMDMELYMTGRERREYQQWREERNRVEEERLARQRTASGEWRREWDRAKDEPNVISNQPFDGPNAADNKGYAQQDRGGPNPKQRPPKATRSPDMSRGPGSNANRGFRGFQGRISNSSQSEDEKVMWDDRRTYRDNREEAEQSAVKQEYVPVDLAQGGLDGQDDEDDDDLWEDVTTSGNESTVSDANVESKSPVEVSECGEGHGDGRISSWEMDELKLGNVDELPGSGSPVLSGKDGTGEGTNETDTDSATEDYGDTMEIIEPENLKDVSRGIVNMGNDNLAAEGISEKKGEAVVERLLDADSTSDDHPDTVSREMGNTVQLLGNENLVWEGMSVKDADNVGEAIAVKDFGKKVETIEWNRFPDTVSRETVDTSEGMSVKKRYEERTAKEDTERHGDPNSAMVDCDMTEDPVDSGNLKGLGSFEGYVLKEDVEEGSVENRQPYDESSQEADLDKDRTEEDTVPTAIDGRVEDKEAQDTSREVQDTSKEVQDLSKKAQELSEKVQEQSKEVQEQSKEVPETRKEVQETPNERQEQSKEVQDTPSEVQDTPSEVQDTPSEVQDTPNEVQDTSSEVQDTSKEVQDLPKEAQELSEKVQEQSKEVKEQSKEVQETPNERQEQSKEVQETPNERQEQSKEVQDTPSEVQDTSKEVQDQSKEAQELSEKVQEQSKEVHEQSKEVHEQSKEVHEQSKEVREQSKEVHEQSKEVQEQFKEVQETPNERREQFKEVHEQSNEVQEQSMEVQEPSKEVQEPSTDVQEQSKEVQEQSKEVQEPFKEVLEQSREAQALSMTAQEPSEDVEETSIELNVI